MFSGATNDNLVKTAFIVAITALSWDVFTLNPVVLANVAALCFILPFIVLAGFAAHQANVQAPKRWLMILKTIELVLALMSAIAIYFKLGWLLLLCIAGFGVQSALIGPLKYALIPQLTEQADLLNKNAWMESATFVAILIGTLIASDWILNSTIHLMTLILLMACTGLMGVLFLPHFDGKADHNQRSIQYLVHQQRQDRQSMSAIWCISGFWGVGSVWLTHLPMLAVDTWQLSPQSIGTLLSYFVLGVTLGACLGVLLKERHLTTRVIAGACTMVFGTLILQVSDFQTAAIGLVLTSAGGGFLVLPLYTLLQDDTAVVANRIAVNNIANAMMIVATAVISLLIVGLLELDLLLWLLALSLGQLFLCLYHRSNLSLS
jgi:hypothetical protein